MIAATTQSSDTIIVAALVLLGTCISSFFGYLGVRAAREAKGEATAARDEAASAKQDLSAVHDEVKSPNGTKTADQVYETGKRVLEIRQQMVEIRETQLAVTRDLAQLAANFVQHTDEDSAHFATVESKMDEVIANQEEIKSSGAAMTERVAVELEALRKDT